MTTIVQEKFGHNSKIHHDVVELVFNEFSKPENLE